MAGGRAAVTTLVVGTDEAGYGPNLGPLVVGATAWEAAAAPGDVEPLFAAAAAADSETASAPRPSPQQDHHRCSLPAEVE